MEKRTTVATSVTMPPPEQVLWERIKKYTMERSSTNTISMPRVKYLKMHSGEKKHKCNMCEHASFSWGILKKHLLTHNGKKFQKCSQCEYAFYHPSSLIRQIKKHSALCSYPLVNMEIGDSSQIYTTAPIFFHYNYFRQTIWRLASVQFHFWYIFGD